MGPKRILTLLVFSLVVSSGCQMSPTPGTHSGDPHEPPWLMNPEIAIGAYPGREIDVVFGSGVSDRGIRNRMIARRQAEANARRDVANRLSQLVSSKVIQWSRDNNVNESVLSSGEIRTMSQNASAEYLSNCEIVERWLSHRTGEYAALARMPFSETAEKTRNQINEILSRKVRNQAKNHVIIEALNRYLGLRSPAAADPPIEPSSFQTLQFSPRNVR